MKPMSGLLEGIRISLLQGKRESSRKAGAQGNHRHSLLAGKRSIRLRRLLSGVTLANAVDDQAERLIEAVVVVDQPSAARAPIH